VDEAIVRRAEVERALSGMWVDQLAFKTVITLEGKPRSCPLSKTGFEGTERTTEEAEEAKWKPGRRERAAGSGRSAKGKESEREAGEASNCMQETTTGETRAGSKGKGPR